MRAVHVRAGERVTLSFTLRVALAENTRAGRLWIEWTGDIGRSRRLSISGESTTQSTVFYTPFNDSIQTQSPNGLLGARIEYGPGDRRWSVGAYARNLTNTDYVTGTFGTPPNAYAGRPGPRVRSRLISPSGDKTSRE